MAQINARFEIENLDSFRRKMRDPDLLGKPIRRALSRSAEFLAGETRQGTPVDTGRLRNSWNTKVDKRRIPEWAEVGTNVSYAEPVEFGSRPHWPPIAALQPWARRHGFPSAFLVARAISIRGTRAHHMLENAMKRTRTFFRKELRRAAKDIERNWSRVK